MTTMSRTILTRRLGEMLVIGDVRVTLAEVRGGAARLGVEAPETTRIFRGELVERDSPRRKKRPRVHQD